MTTECADSGEPGAARRVAVLGGGSWGTVLARVLDAHGHEVRLWARSEALIQAIARDGENRRYLPSFPVSAGIRLTADIAVATADADALVFAVPSSALRETAALAASAISGEPLLLSAAKGLEQQTGLRMSEVLRAAWPRPGGRIVALSGPNLALEVAQEAPTASVVASDAEATAAEAQALFLRKPAPAFRVYRSSDIIGVELGGALKNVIAIGAGLCEGLGYGDNSRATFLTRGLAEIMRVGAAMGARRETFMGLSGVGDLIVTGASRLSRNFRVGVGLGQGRVLEDILAELGQVAEGVPTTRVVCEIAERHGAPIPLCRALHSVLFDGRDARAVIRDLLLRTPGQEIDCREQR